MTDCGDPNCGKEDYVYDMKWTPEIADHFILHMAFLHKKGQFVPGECMVDTLFKLQAEMEHKFGLHFHFKHFIKKIAELEKRYNVFTWILSHPGVEFDATNNKVLAPQLLWEYLMKTEQTAFLYRRKGEARYEQLKQIFGGGQSSASNS